MGPEGDIPHRDVNHPFVAQIYLAGLHCTDESLAVPAAERYLLQTTPAKPLHPADKGIEAAPFLVRHEGLAGKRQHLLLAVAEQLQPFPVNLKKPSQLCIKDIYCVSCTFEKAPVAMC